MSSIPVPSQRPFIDAARARKLMFENGLDALVANSMRNVFYMTGFPGFDYLIEPEASSFAVLGAKDEQPSVTVAVSERYVTDDFPVFGRQVVYGNYYVKGAPPTDPAPGTFDALIGMIDGAVGSSGRIGVEFDQMPVGLHARLKERLLAIVMVDGAPIFRELRTVKTPEEVDRVRKATQVTEEAINDAFARVQVGTTERQIANWINEGVIARGADPLYVTMGVAGRGAYGVGYPTDRKIAKGEVVRADVSARYGHYHSDLGRCCIVGKPSKEQREYYKVAYEALQAGINAVSAGRPIGEVFAAGMDVPRRLGHPDFKRHHIGHGIGLQAHEWPFLKPNVQDPIQVGMVLAVEVPYYVYGLGGFSPEDILVVKETGVELFSHAPAELPVVG